MAHYYEKLDEDQHLNVNVKNGLADSMLRKVEEKKKMTTTTIVCCFLLALSLTFFLIGFFVPAPGDDTPSQSSGFFIGMIVTASILGFFAVLILLVIPFQIRVNNISKRNMEAWAAETACEWGDFEYTSSEWQRYLLEEFGRTGRSTVKYTWATYVTWVATWILLFGFSCIIIAIKFINVEISGSDVFGIPFSQFIVYLALALATFGTILTIVSPVIKYYVAKRTCERPLDFRGTSCGMFWMEQFLCWAPEESSCCLPVFTLAGIRLNTYRELMHPCLEVCITYSKDNSKVTQFYRIPVPKNFRERALAYVEEVTSNNCTDNECWTKLVGYAKDLENGVDQLVETCM